jgi:hypothetical protein
MIGEHIDINTLPSEYGGDGLMPSFDVRTYLASDPYLRLNNYDDEINSTLNNDYVKNCDDNDNTNNRNNATDNNDYDNNHNHDGNNDTNNNTNGNNNNHNNYDDNYNSSQENMSCRKQPPPIYS